MDPTEVSCSAYLPWLKICLPLLRQRQAHQRSCRGCQNRGPVREAIGYGIALVIWILVFGIIARLIRIADNLPIVSTVNRLLGFVFGAVSGLLVVWTILAILGGVQEYSWAVQIVKAARANSVVMWLQSYSPIMIILQMMDFPVI